MEINKRYWEYGGAILLSGFSSLIFLEGSPEIWVPMPLYMIILGWISPFFIPLLTPVLYLLNMKLFSKSKYFSIITTYLIVFFGVLNLWFFTIAWSYGLRWQGFEHTLIAAMENIVGFGAALLLSIWSHFRKSEAVTYAANLILFIILSWCAFPYLGELP